MADYPGLLESPTGTSRTVLLRNDSLNKARESQVHRVIPPPPSNMPPPPRKELSDSWCQRNPSPNLSANSSSETIERARKTLLPNIVSNVQKFNQEIELYDNNYTNPQYDRSMYGYDGMQQGASKIMDSSTAYPTQRKTLVSTPPMQHAFSNYDYQPIAPRSMAMESHGVKAQFEPQSAKSPLDMEVQNVLTELHQEIAIIDQTEYAPLLKNAKRLLKTETFKLENNIDPDWVEVDVEKPIKVTKKILVPYYRYPHLNWVGKILGAKGGTVRNIMDKFKCNVTILGAHSTRDRQKEVELLNSGDPQFAHFASPLHVQVSTTGPAHLAYMRVAHVMKVFNKLLQLGTHEIEGITVSFYSDTDNKKDGKRNNLQQPKKSKSYETYNEDDEIIAPAYDPLDFEEEQEDYEYEEEDEEIDEEPPQKKPNAPDLIRRGGKNGSVPNRGSLPKRGSPPNRNSHPYRGSSGLSRGASNAFPTTSRGSTQLSRGATRGSSNDRGRGGFVPKRGGGFVPRYD
uniref:K Homology domain-containing protein n=1 Tax=Acrobeloides nanus TaxID=290746 RepID=A0A914DEH3_9BILA